MHDNWGLSEDDFHFVKELIFGAASEAPPGHTWKGRGLNKAFLYEIVANHRNEIDVDKFDYFVRDTHALGLKMPFSFNRLMQKYSMDSAVVMTNLPMPSEGMAPARYMLQLEQLNVELHPWPEWYPHGLKTYRELHALFAGALRCGLVLHHKERNSWGCDGYACIEYSWVSATHARRTFMSLRASLSESHRRIHVRS